MPTPKPAWWLAKHAATKAWRIEVWRENIHGSVKISGLKAGPTGQAGVGPNSDPGESASGGVGRTYALEEVPW